MYYFLVISVIIVFLFLYNYYHFNPAQLLTFKIVTSLCFIILAVLAYILNKEAITYFWLMMVGLSFGFLGDVSLGLKEINAKNRTKYLAMGIILFFIGHLFYIITMSKFINNYLLYIIFSLFLLIVNLLFFYWFKFDCGRLQYKVIIYMGITSVFLVVCILNAIINPSLFKAIIAIGAACFVGSDCLLLFLYFKKIEKYRKLLKRLNLLLYYSGQFLLALSIYLY